METSSDDENRYLLSSYSGFREEYMKSFLHDAGHVISSISYETQRILSKAQYARSMDPKIIEHIRSIGVSCERLHAMFANVSGFYKPENDAYFSLPEAISEVRKMISHQLETHQTGFDVECEDVLIFGPEKRFQAMLLALLNNAMDASRHNRGSITLVATVRSTNENGRFIELSISDNGEGIPLQFRSQIFNFMFTTRANRRGNGLTLAKVTVEDSFKGTINIVSYGNPTTVIITIPLL
jgi:signal transduction histidine kinase